MSTVNIFSRFFNKGFKDAEAALKANDRRTKYWAKKQAKYYAAATAAATYYAQKALRTSIREALADEKSQRILATTLKNVAMATDGTVASTEAQIRSLQQLYGIADDQLRPALARLVRSTGTVSEGFKGLNLALDISTATGKSLEAVTAALGKAYDGNYASLQRLGLGLDASLLKTKDQEKIMETLRTTFSGFARKEAVTAEGKFRRIKVAAQEASEVIGKALVDAIAKVADQGGNDIDGLTTKMNRFAAGVGAIVTSIGDLTAEVTKPAPTKLPWYLDIGTTLREFLYSQTIFAYIFKQGDKAIKQAKVRADLAQLEKSRTEFSVKNRREEIRLAEYLIKKRKEEKDIPLPTANPKTLEQLMAEEAARKAGFKLTEDIDSIQTVAAAKRLEESRQYKASVIDAAQAQFEAIKKNYDLLNTTWEVQKSAFDVFLAYLKSKSVTIPVNFTGGALPTPGSTPSLAAALPEQGIPSFTGGMGTAAAQGGALALGGQTITINVNAGAIGSEDYLVGVIGDALTKYTRYGNTTAPAGFI